MASVFSGTFAHSLDQKGRVIIPVSFREKLGTGFTIALNNTIDALAIYPLAKWEEVNEQLSRVKDTDDEGMDYVRYMMANAQTDMEMDAQGRVLLPQPLRDAVGLTKDLTFVGVFTQVEIWDTAAYTEKMNRSKERFAKLRRHVNDTY